MVTWLTMIFSALRHRGAILAVAFLLPLAASARAQAPDSSPTPRPAADAAPPAAASNPPAGQDLDLEGVVFRPLPPLHAAPALPVAPAWAAPCAIDPAVVAMMNEAGNVLDVELPLGANASVVARLRRFDVVAPDATLILEGAGGLRTPLALTVSTWTGHLLDDPDAEVFLGLSPTQAQGWITTRGTTFLIATRTTPAGPLTLAYDQNDFDLPGEVSPPSCAGALSPPGDTAPPPTGEAGYAPRVACLSLRVAIDTDEEFAALAGGGQNAAEYAVILVAASSSIYTREIGMGLQLGFLRIWSAPDPWTAANTADQLNEFLTYWKANMPSVPRASAHLFSGRALGGGIAYVRQACSSDYGYAVSANLAGAFPLPILDNASSNWDLMVVTHEWGHQFGTGHTHNSCEYNPIIDACGLRPTSSSCENGTQDCTVATAQNGTIMSYCHTCSGGMRNVKMAFGPRVVDRIASYVSAAPCASWYDPPILANIAASPAATVCAGTPITLTANASGSNLRFQWFRNGSRVFGATTPSFTIASPVNGDRWDVMVYAPCGVILTQGTPMGVVISTAASGVGFGPGGTVAIADAAGNANGRIDPGEVAVALTIPVRNAGPSVASGVTATLASNTPTVSIANATASYPAIAACAGTASNPSPFLIDVATNHPCGTPISLTLTVTSAQGSNAFTFSLPVGIPGSVAAPVTVSYTGPIVPIPDNLVGGRRAFLPVTGLAGTIVDVDFRFDGSDCNAVAGSTTVGLDHTYVGDLSVSLISPAGTTVNLMNRPGTEYNSGLNFCGTRLDDDAPNSIQAIVPADNPWTGTYAPANELAAFNGQNPEGTWALQVIDSGPADTGYIRAFSLIITVRTSSSCTPFCQSPSITAQPTSRTVCVNASTTFTLTPAGSAPFTYQWRKAGVTIDGATSASFTIPSVAAADAASYDCVVSNACGSVTSAAATLAVNPAPAITTQPASTVSCAGATASFTVAATGTTPLTYQWRKNGAAIPSATFPTYTILSVVAADAGSFDCVVTNACGTATSAAATLTVSGTVLSFTTQPVSLTRCAREEANFSVTVTGSSPTFQWRKDGVAIPGATSSIFTIPSVQAVDIGGYDCVVTNSCGSVNSSLALLRVNVPPSITSNPTHVSACPGTSASFSVTAGGTRTLTYQWRKDGTPITGATAATYTIASVAATDAASYDCVVTNGCGNATSAPALLSVGGHWLPGDALAGVGGDVYATVAWDPDGAGPLGTMVVAGGAFTAAGGVNANRIAMFDPQTSTWSALGSGMNGPVYALAVLRSGDLVAAGSFNTAGGLAANGIARWNGSSWSVLGSGLSGPVYALAVLANGDTVAAGGFTTAGGVPVNFIARWNGVSWSAMGAGMDNEVRALSVLPGGDLVAGGAFTLAGGLFANRIARWNGASWSALGSGVNNTVYALSQLQGGDLVVGGSFTTAGGLAANRIARWNGAAWSTFSTGMNGDVYALTLLPNGNLVAGGAFSAAGSSTAAWLASWNGSAWSSLGAGVEGGIFAFALLPGGDLIAGGTFLSAGGASAGRIARWNGAAWSTMGSGLSGRVLALASNSSGETFVGGTVTAAGAVTLNNVGKWNGSTWSSLAAGTNGSVTALALLPGGDLVAGGTFTAAGGTPANAIARWNGTAWSALGTGVNSTVNALAVLSNGELVAGGSFTTAGGAAVNRVARWNGTAWSALGVGLSGGVNALALLPSGDLVAGGSFTFAGVASTPGIARWNGASWFSLGTGVNGTVNALAVLPGGVLVAGGSFTTAGGVAVSNVARWNGSAWSAMGTGINGAVNALAVLPSGELIAGGSFLTAGGVTVNRVAKWDGISWSSLGAGMDNTVLALSPLSGGDFIAGGGFATAGGRVAANLARYAASGAPAVAAQPASQSVCTGQTLTLVAAPANGYPNASFQWRRNGVNIANGAQGASAGGGTVSGASGSFPSPTAASSTTLTIASLAASDAGSYTCVFSNACGSVTTTAAAVAVNVSPVITSQPVSQASCAGTSATFSLVASGTPTLTFQWRKGGVNISGATAASYTIASVAAADAASYDCVVTNACASVTSAAATLTVNTAPVITTQPTPRTLCAGASTTFTAAASGTLTPTFQWRKGGVNIGGATSASYTIASVAAADAGSYDCVVTNACGSVTSTAATLAVNTAPAIISQPVSQSACSGTSTSFTIAASGTPAPSFQWRKGGVNISGATAASLPITNASAADAGSYDCVVTNSCGSVTSVAATLTFNIAPVITTQPASLGACAGASATFTVAASASPSPTFQWRKGGVNIGGATAASYTIASVAAADAATYDCVVSNLCGSVTTSAATLSLNTAPVITTQPTSRTACAGGSTTFTVAATGTPSPAFQWRKGGVNIGGATAASFTIVAVSAADAASYDCVVSNACASVTSAAATLAVNLAPTISTQPAAQAACPGTSTTFTVAATGAPSPTFQWRKGGVNISGATAASYTIASVAAADAASYDCVVTNACGSVTSSAASLSLNAAPSITTQPVPQNVCVGSSLTLSVAATGAPAPTFQWRKTGVNIPGATAASFTIPSLAPTDAGGYDCVVTNACGSVTSNNVSVGAWSPPVVTTQPVARSACAGLPTTFTVAVSSGPSPTYQWRKGGVNIGGAVGASYTIAAVTAGDAASYDCVVTNTCGSVTSNAASLTVNAAPVITTQPASRAACPGSSTTFTVAASGTPTFQWRKSGVNISGATSASYTIASVAGGDVASYDCVVTNACGSVASAMASLSLNVAVVITTQPTARTVCAGASTTFTVAAGGTPAPTFQWRKGGVNIGGATSASYTIASVAAGDAASYDCVVANACGSVTSTAASLTVNTSPIITTQPASRVSCPGASTTFTVVAAGTPAPTFQWRKGGVNIGGATFASFTIASVQAADAASYDCVVTNACGSATSGVATLSLNAPPVITTQPVPQAICVGSSVALSVAATGTPAPTFQWRKNGVAIAGATSASFTIASAAAADAASYDCVVTNPCASVTSVSVAVSVGAAPSNDRVSNPFPLVPGVVLDGNTSCASIDAADAPVCGAQPVTAPGLWYRLAGTGTSVTVSLCGSAFDTRLSAFCGSPGSFTCVAGNDDSCSLQSSVTFCTQAGADYHILVHGFGGAAGPFAILATAAPSPCTNPVACLPVGACCADNGCTQLTAAQCAQLGGTFLGVGTPCDTVSYNDLAQSPGPFPLPILDFTTVTASITLPAGSGMVDGLAVRLNLLHTYVGDLTITLTHGATSVTLVAPSGGGADLDGVYTFSDRASTPFAVAASGVAQVPPGTFQPGGTLAAFNGQPFDGLWTLSVRDGATGDAGQLRDFALIAVATSPACNSCPPCIADYNLDGGVDSGDIGAFFDAWEASQPCTDVNADGGIDFGDVNDFFAAWENGGC